MLQLRPGCRVSVTAYRAVTLASVSTPISRAISSGGSWARRFGLPANSAAVNSIAAITCVRLIVARVAAGTGTPRKCFERHANGHTSGVECHVQQNEARGGKMDGHDGRAPDHISCCQQHAT